MTDSRNWIKEALPDSVSKLAPGEKKRALARFSSLVECRQTPIAGTPRAMRYAFFCPRPPLIVRAVPGGVVSLDAEEGYDYDQKMDNFFEGLDTRIYFWAIGNEDIGIFEGPYNEEIRWWIQRNIIFTPTIIMACDLDVVLISHEQWHFSLVGGSSEVIRNLEQAFGGYDGLRTTFIEWVDEQGVGFGEEGRLWAYKYPVRWSGWS